MSKQSTFSFKNLLKPNQKTFDVNPETWFAICIGVSIISFLTPFHTHLGKDFLPNAFSYICMVFGLMVFLPMSKLEKVSLATLSWLAFACYLIFQTFFGLIRYPDAMIFPVVCLVVAGLLTLASSNIIDKKAFLNKVFIATYIMALGSFIIQVLQIFELQWTIGFVELTHLAGNGRLFANFLQPNHAAHAFILAFCGVIYHLSIIKKPPHRSLLWILFLIFSVAIAFTKSRAGLVMAVGAIGVFFISQPITIKQKIRQIMLNVMLFLTIYVVASLVLNQMNISTYGGNLGAIGRLTEGGNRTVLAKQALIVFGDNPLFGVGWNNYVQAGIEHAHIFNWRENPDHSHNFLTMILAELGIFGVFLLIPILMMLWRCVHFKHSAESAVALAFVIATIAYASVEYPLWFFRYLAIFAVCLGLVEQRYAVLPRIFNEKNTKAVLSISLLLSALIAENYIWQFVSKRFHDSQRYFYVDLYPTAEDKLSADTTTFGFSFYHGQILASQTWVTPEGDIQEKLRIFRNAMNVFGSQYYTLAYAKMLAFDGQHDKALEYIKIACVRNVDVKVGCEQVTQDLQKTIKKYPEPFTNLLEQFQKWRSENPEKTGFKP